MLGETIGFWVQTVALIASAIAAVLLILSSRKGEERRATIELVLEQNRNSEIKEAKLVLHDLHAAGTQNFASFLNKRDGDEYRHILRVLNTYEFIAAAIRENALDEDLFKRMQCTIVLKDWTALKPFVLELRKQDNHPTLFQELELMAERWKKNPLVCDAN